MTAKTKPTIAATLNERGARYGSFAVNAAIAQNFKTVAHNSPEWWGMQQYQREAMEVILSKFSRMLTGDVLYIDNWTDVAGYAQLVIDELRRNPDATDAVVTIVKASAK